MQKKLLPLFARPPLQHSDCSMRLARQRGLQQLSLKHDSKSKQHNPPSSKQHNIESNYIYQKANNNNRRNQH